MGLKDRLYHAYNAFMNRDPTRNIGPSSGVRPGRARMTRGNERTIMSAITARIAIDTGALDFKHVRLDDNKRYSEDIDSGLNTCLTLEANIDQDNRSFIRDIVISLLDEGCVAVVPVDTISKPNVAQAKDILSMRTARIIQWYPRHVQVEIYNDKKGNHERLICPKDSVAIVENPLYSVLNEPNSTLQRLIRKLSLLDNIDEESSAGKLDMIIQLPYVIKTQARKDEAERRRKEIEEQLSSSKYGIAYTDGTEKVTQLNKSLENNLLSQVEYLTNLLYSQLGLSQTILDGTADEKTMLNYYNRTIEPIAEAIVCEFRRKFLTKTGRTQRQSVLYFRDPFKLIPVNNIADIADKFTRNEIMTSNEVRQIVGLKPAADPNADTLRNKNLNMSDEQLANGVIDAQTGERVDAGQGIPPESEETGTELAEQTIDKYRGMQL